MQRRPSYEATTRCSSSDPFSSRGAQPNVSKHVKILLEAGLIARRQEGNTVYCSIGDDSVFELCDVVCSSIRDRLTAQSAVLERPRTRR